MRFLLRYPIGLWLLIAVFFAAPWWVPPLKAGLNFSLFLAPDSLISLGASLAFGLICQSFLPDTVLKTAQNGVEWVKNHRTIVSWLFLGILLLSFYWINRAALHRFMNSADEFCGWFLAECIKNGKFWSVPPPVADFFEMMHVANRGGKWFGVYPPGWPLLYAAGLKLNAGDWVNPVLGTLSVVFLFKTAKKLFGFSTAALGAGIMGLSPFFLFNNASYYSHTVCLLSASVFLYAYFRWTERKEMGWAALSAFAMGYGLITRYLTMLAIGAPFLIYELILLFTKREDWKKSHLAFAAVLGLMLTVNLYYNRLITGNFFDVPSHYYHRWERLGFQDDYTPLNAAQYILARFFFIMDWFPSVLLVFYLIGLFQQKKETVRHRIFRWGYFYLVIAYIFYYSWGGNQYGPRYYFEAFPFLAFSAADAMASWWRRRNIKTQKFLTGILIAAALTNGYLIRKQIVFYEQVSRERKALYDLAESTIQAPAIVFIRGFLGDKLVMAQEDAIRNHPDLNTKVIYAHDLGKKNKALKHLFPDRAYYLGTYDRSAKKPRLEVIER